MAAGAWSDVRPRLSGRGGGRSLATLEKRGDLVAPSAHDRLGEPRAVHQMQRAAVVAIEGGEREELVAEERQPVEMIRLEAARDPGLRLDLMETRRHGAVGDRIERRRRRRLETLRRPRVADARRPAVAFRSVGWHERDV